MYLCYGARAYVAPVVDALTNQTYPKDAMKVYMIASGSTDGVQDEIRTSVLPRSGVDLPETVLLDDGVNRGFAGNNNVAIRAAFAEGFDYVFLHNGDLRLHPGAIEELVKVAESDAKIASVQSMVYYWHEHGVINTSGGEFHVAGYGYARDNLTKAEDVAYEDASDIAYASGAAVLYRSSVLEEVGLLEEGFFMYHEDLELGLRLRMAGYKNVLATKSWAYHDYHFSQNPKKFAWTELYRWVVVQAYYKWPTLLLLTPLLILVEIGTWAMALRGGWITAKFYQYREALRPRTWALVFRMRGRAQRLRTIKDADLLRFVTGKIEAQEQHNWVLEHFANPVIAFWLSLIKRVVTW